MNKLFKYFSLFFLLMVCNYTNVQAIDINGNILENGDFTQKDKILNRNFMPSDWNINQGTSEETFDVNPTFDVVEQQEYEGIIKNPEFKKDVSSGRVTSVPNWNFAATRYSLDGETYPLIFADTLIDDSYTKMTRLDGGNLSGLGEIGIANTNDDALNASVNGTGGILLFVYQTIETTPGQSYEFSVDLSSEGTDKRGFTIYDGKNITSGPTGKLGGVDAKTPGVTGSETLKTIFTAKSDKTTISFRFYAAANTSHIDSIKNPTIQEINLLPSYSKWKDSNTDTIPKENAFVMMYSDNTKVEEYSDGIKMEEALSKNADLVEFDPTNGTQWIRWSNVGYYKGQNIGVKLSVTPDKKNPGPNSDHNKIGFRGTQFLKVDIDKYMGFLDVEYEFLDEQGEPISVSGYWTLDKVSDSKFITLNTEQFDHLYSIPATGPDYSLLTNPILISYDLKGNMIEMTGHGHRASGNIPNKPDNLIDSQLQTTVTYTNQQSFSYVLSSTPSNVFSSSSVPYVSSSIAKVEIPDPQPVNQTVEKITKGNRDKLTNEFVQQIPYQSDNNRDQKMTWNVSNIKNDDVFSSGDWKVYDETGKEQTDFFEFTENNKTIKPKDLSNENLYNHYYRFVYSLPFDESKEIQENQLVEQNNGKYLKYSQDISLEVDSLSPIVATPTTDINFMATINYSYTDENDKPITMDDLAKTGTSLITKPYPVTEAPEIKGYTPNGSEPSDLTNKKILYTDNSVNFIYDKIKQQTQWLPSYSKWKEATSNTIPKTNTFMMMKTQETSVSDVVGLTHANGRYQFSSGEADTPRSLIYHNVGYSDGSPVSVKITLSPNAEVADLNNNFIGFETGFMNIGVKSKPGVPVEMSVKYEFLDDNNKPINLSGYWTVSGLNQFKRVNLPNKQIENIYSYARGTSPQTTIQYEEDDKNITLIGTSTAQGTSGEGVEATITYNDLNTFDFVVIPSKENDPIQLNYNQSSIPKVGIPDPQPVKEVIDNITKDNRDNLNNKFIQYIPFQSPNNRNQDMTWTVSNIKNDDVFSSGDWEVYDEKGDNQTDLFEFDKDNKTIEPKDLSNKNLYNHYYRFVYSLPFDESKEIQENQLVEQNNGKYLNYSQDISLKVDSLSPVVATPTTDINFMATINYSYTDEEGKPIIMDGLAETGTGLITQPYPVNEAPDIQGYTFNKSEPSDLMNKKILYTDNPVNFIYDRINKVQMTVNYYQLDREGKETTHKVIDNLQTGETVNALVEEVEVGEKISDFIPQSDFNSYLYNSSIVTNDVTNETIEDDIVPMDDFTVNRYYQPLENLSVPKTISFGDKNAQRLKDEYSVKNDPSPINLTSGYSDVNWSLHASSDGLFSEGTNTRLLSDMYFRLNNEKMIINKEDTILASQINKHYYDLPLVTEDNKEGLFLEIGNSGTKDSKYSGEIKFSMVTGP